LQATRQLDGVVPPSTISNISASTTLPAPVISSVPIVPSVLAVTVPAAPAAPIVIVKQPQLTKPYSEQTSWKSHEEYFTRLALCNGLTTGVEQAQNLLIAMEGAAAETVCGLTANKDEDYEAIWDNLLTFRTHR